MSPLLIPAVAVLTLISEPLPRWGAPRGHAVDRPLPVFILAGQSNMVGQAKVSLLEYQAARPATRDRFAHLRDGDTWRERDDVWIRFGERHGPLTVGYGNRDCIGPELGFGFTVGDRIEGPVLLIKTAWGGKSLMVDFRPPSAGEPPEGLVARLLENRRKKAPDATEADVRASFGHFYRQMMAEVQDTLRRVDEFVPVPHGAPELAGFVWFQGWNDMIHEEYTAAYADNLVHLVQDVRRDLDAPDLPVVIGQMGVGGTTEVEPKHQVFKDAQAAAAAHPDLAGNVTLVATDVFWDEEADAVFQKGWKEHVEEWEKVGSDYPYHYLGSARCSLAMGEAFGAAMLALCAATDAE